MRRPNSGLLLVVFTWTTWTGGAHAQENCTRTLSSSPAVYDDATYSETSMSYRWMDGEAPDWFDEAIKKWNACPGAPSLSTGTGGEKAWSVRRTRTRPDKMPRSACGYTDSTGKIGAPQTIWLIKGGTCPLFLKKVFLHEAGHSLGVAHDGPGCPDTIMRPQLPLPSFDVSTVNCKAVEKFKKEKINRDKEPPDGGGGGDRPGPGGPDRGDDPISRCTANPDACVEVEPPLRCSSTWNSESQTLTVTCTYY